MATPPVAPPLTVTPPSSGAGARPVPGAIEIRIRMEQLVREAKETMMEAIEDHKADVATTDKRFSKKVKNALAGKNVSHHKLDLAVKAAQGVWEGAKSLLSAIVPGIDIAGKVVAAVGAVGTAYFTDRARSGGSVNSTAASLFNVNLNEQILNKLQSIQDHGESLALWSGEFMKFAEKGVKSRGDLKDFYRAFRKLDLHVKRCETDFREMNLIFERFYLAGKNYVVNYKARKDEVETRLAEIFTSTLLNPMTHWQCIQDKKADPTVECFVDFDLDNFFGLFPLPLTAATFQRVKAELRHVPPPARKFFLDTNIDGPLGILGGSFVSSALMDTLKATPTARNLHMSVGPVAMNGDAWKAASRLGVSLRGGLNLRGSETEAIDKSVNSYATAAITSIRKNLLQSLADTPQTAVSAAQGDLRLRLGALTTVQGDIDRYLQTKQGKTAERKVFVERLHRLAGVEATALKHAQAELTKVS